MHRAHYLVKLTRKGAPWEFGLEQLDTMADLKSMLLESPVLHPINYRLDVPVIISVNTSYIAVGYIVVNLKLRYHALISMPGNDQEYM